MTDAAAHVLGRRAAFLPASAVRRLNDAIEALIALADELAPDCDLEPSLGAREDLEGSGDQAFWASGGRSDFERDAGDEPHLDTFELGEGGVYRPAHP